MRTLLRKAFVVTAAALSLGAATTAAAVPAATAQVLASPYERGPEPTDANLRAALGTFSYSTVRVTNPQGFGGGTIYYPNDTSAGTFGGVAVVPGYTSPESAVAWLGPRLASRGFVVITIATNSTGDQPDARGRQLLAALDHLTQRSPQQVRDRLDTARLAVMGHSMGGGGSLYAANARPSIKAAVPLAPYHTDRTWPTISTPTMVVGGSRDTTTSISSFTRPIYDGLTGARERAFVNVSGATHGTFTRENPVIGKYATAWLKRFVDADTRYDRFLCPPPADPALVAYLASCPNS